MTTTRPASSLNKAALFRDLGYRPHSGQVVVHRSRAPRRVLACGVRWGKSLCAAMEAIAAALEPKERSIGWCVAPTYDLADRIFREIQLVVLQHLQPFVIAVKESERRLLLRNLAGGVSEVRAKSADNPVSLLGEGLDWLILDEAARVKPSVWESCLLQRLVDKRGWALLISTPRGKGWFYEAFRRGQAPQRDPDFESWNWPSSSNPHLDPNLIEAERARLPERVYLQEFCGQFIEGAGAVFRNVRECATGTFSEKVEGVSYHGGLDLARVEDFTVATIVHKDREQRKVLVDAIDRFHKLDWSLQVQRIVALSRKYSATLLCDTTGVGDPVHESLRGAGAYVNPYPFTLASKNALVNNIAMMLERRRVVLPKPELAPELIDELEAFEYSVTERGAVRSSAPSGQHDDCVMSLGLALWEVRPDRPRPGIDVCRADGTWSCWPPPEEWA